MYLYREHQVYICVCVCVWIFLFLCEKLTFEFRPSVLDALCREQFLILYELKIRPCSTPEVRPKLPWWYTKFYFSDKFICRIYYIPTSLYRSVDKMLKSYRKCSRLLLLHCWALWPQWHPVRGRIPDMWLSFIAVASVKQQCSSHVLTAFRAVGSSETRRSRRPPGRSFSS
jgi:hypothetical protein